MMRSSDIERCSIRHTLQEKWTKTPYATLGKWQTWAYGWLEDHLCSHGYGTFGTEYDSPSNNQLGKTQQMPCMRGLNREGTGDDSGIIGGPTKGCSLGA